MKYKIQRFILLGYLSCYGIIAVEAKDLLPYRNKNLPIEIRVQDLLSRMTLKEKIGQILCTMSWDYYTIDGKKAMVSDKFIEELKDKQMGMLWATYRADPWTRKTLSNGLNPMLAAKVGNALQRYVVEKTRLGIPLFLAEEAPHGHMAIGTTVFPTGLGMAATWDTNLIEEAGNVISREIRLQGGHISYGPVLDLARDPRWSRVEETMGEDPVLSAKIGAAEVRGLGGGNLSLPTSTLVSLKHFIAYGIPEGGQNGGPALIGQRELMDCFLPPFRKSIDAGALSVMTAYNSIDGVPCTSNSFLLTNVLRNIWKFKGLVVSDLYSIDGIFSTHDVAASIEDAGVAAVNAGVDVDLGANAFIHLVDAVKSGKIKEAIVDTAVARVLKMKMQMGLFENPYVSPKMAAKYVRNAANIDVAYRVAQASVTLLKNENNILPLSKNMHVAVIGPNADNKYNMLGDYTAPQEDSNVKTILAGINKKLPAENVEYVKGCDIRDTTLNEINKAVEAANRSDIVIVAVGGSSARDFKTSYKETGAAITDDKHVSDMDCGEGFDRESLTLFGRQNQLLSALRKTGRPMVVVYIEGRPLDKTWAAQNADALITAYYPGQEGGLAIADVLFGDYNPAGRLPISVPRNIGQLPVYYNKKKPTVHNYVEMSASPLYPFGYGLSYTSFKYSNLLINGNLDKGYTVSFDITNTGNMDGEEVPQLYITDEISSVVQPIRQLKDFTRVYIHKNETRNIKMLITYDDLAFTGIDMTRRVEPGDFDIQIGTSSTDIRLHSKLTLK